MVKAIASAFLLIALAACATVQQPVRTTSACDVSEVSYECQVERYNSVGIQ